MTRDPLPATPRTRLHPLESDEFLPPLSRWTTLGGLFLVGTFGAIVALASVTQYRLTIKAAAIVRPAGDVRIVQTAIEGTVESLATSDNQTVKAGDPIASIDESRLRSQKSHLADNIQHYQSESMEIDRQIRELNNQILATVQLQDTPSDRPLSEKAVEVALVQLATSIPDVAQRFGKDRRSLLVKQSEIQKQLSQSKKELHLIEMKLKNSIVRAPISGTILKMEVKNLGQPVHPGMAIAQIVPSDVPLVIKARVTAQDIGQVKGGQPVQIRISAFPYPDYGTLKGVVTTISPDAIAPPILGSGDAYYEVTIQPERQYLIKESSTGDGYFNTSKTFVAQQYPIQSGMEGRADIITSEETVLAFILRKTRLLVDF